MRFNRKISEYIKIFEMSDLKIFSILNFIISFIMSQKKNKKMQIEQDNTK